MTVWYSNKTDYVLTQVISTFLSLSRQQSGRSRWLRHVKVNAI